MIDLGALTAIGVAFFVVAASPGPGNLAGATVAMTHGRRVGLTFAAGLATGLAFWGLVAAMGMGAILQSSATALFVLKLAGGVYLLWLAALSARSSLSRTARAAVIVTGGRWYVRGLLLNLSNPKAVLAWMAAFSVGLDPANGPGTLIAAMVLCFAITALNATFWAVAFSFGGMMRAYRAVRRRVDAVVAGLFAIAGFGLIRSAFAR
ncbi:MAG: LysE family translocator [Rhodobacteraceae bacterium]|nr:LysE family translocator [Paracoccaceae bacterium]